MGGFRRMFPGRKIARRIFAPASLGFILAAMGAFFAIADAGAAEATATGKRQAASTQFARAEEQRDAMNSKAAEKRVLADYKQVAASYRRVALITPRAPEVPDSLIAVAELYAEMGGRFGRSYYQSAVEPPAHLRIQLRHGDGRGWAGGLAEAFISRRSIRTSFWCESTAD